MNEWQNTVSVGYKCITKKALQTDARGRVKYRGRWFVIDKPVTSTRKDKKKMVLASKGGCLKLVHFGDPAYRHNYSEAARENYLKRSAGIRDGEGNLTKNNKHSANYWARKILWK